MNVLGGLGSGFFKWVLQTTWQAAVLAGLILLVQVLFRKQLTAAWRYRLWLLVVVRLLIPIPPSSALSIFNLVRIEPVRTRLAAGTDAVSRSTLPPDAAAAKKRWIATPGAVSPSKLPAVIGPGDSQLQSENSERGSSARRAEFWYGIALRLWLVGACVFGLRLVWTDARFRSRLAPEAGNCRSTTG